MKGMPVAKPAPAPTPRVQQRQINPHARAAQRPPTTDDDDDPKTTGEAAKETGRAFLSSLASLVRGILFPSEPDRESSRPKNISQLARELNAAADDIDMTNPKGLGHAIAAGAFIAVSEALSEGYPSSSEASTGVGSQRGPQAVIDKLASNLENGTLSNLQTRDWYIATKVVRAAIIDKMEAAGYSDEEVAREARDLMEDREAAATFERKSPNLTWEEAVKKYNGDYNLITKKSLESNEEIDKLIEQMRQNH
jgi:hypothetical protein